MSRATRSRLTSSSRTWFCSSGVVVFQRATRSERPHWTLPNVALEVAVNVSRKACRFERKKTKRKVCVLRFVLVRHSLQQSRCRGAHSLPGV